MILLEKLLLHLFLLNMKNTNLVLMRTVPFSSISIETAHVHCASYWYKQTKWRKNSSKFNLLYFHGVSGRIVLDYLLFSELS